VGGLVLRVTIDVQHDEVAIGDVLCKPRGVHEQGSGRLCERGAAEANREADPQQSAKSHLKTSHVIHSVRKTTCGSTRVARQAGPRQAAPPASTSAAVTAAKVSGSVGVVSKRYAES